MWDGLGRLLALSGLMALASFLAGSLPLSFSLSRRQIRLISAVGTGLLIGTALIVIIPEGIETLYSSSAVSVPHTAQIAPIVDPPMDNDRAALTLHNIPKPDKNAAGNGIKYENQDVKGTDRFLPGEKEPDPPKGSEPKSAQIRRSEPDQDHEKSTPHAWIGISLILGFILMYLIDILPTIKSSPGASSNGHTHHIPLSTMDPESTHSSHQKPAHYSPSRPNPTTVGLLIHALGDGIALGASSTTGSTTARGGLSIVIFMAILVHKAPAAFGLTAILLKQGVSKRSARGHLLLFSFAAPLGALVTWMIINILGKGDTGQSESMKWWTGIALMFSGGTFLYVALHAMQTISSSSSHSGHSHAKAPAADGGEDWEAPYAEADGHSMPTSQAQERTRGEVCLVVAGMLLPLLTQIGHTHAHG
ncbi:Zinc/iron permease [Venturia nashicola]|uniref:Zinc/iron permease n=1 Tax=Venturia nashicola TaxID=86259 RepID=A0A4Z1P4N6_9PEZI|nr:Zinc/iron permease [Venturia nashicola]